MTSRQVQCKLPNNFFDLDSLKIVNDISGSACGGKKQVLKASRQAQDLFDVIYTKDFRRHTRSDHKKRF